MRLRQMISYDEIYHLIKKGVVKIENRTKYKKEILLYSLSLIVTIFPIWVLIAYFDPTSILFLIFLGVLDLYMFLIIFENLKVAKSPNIFFWKYFINKKFKLKFLGTIEENGEEYAVHGFVNEECLLSICAFMLLKIKKDIHRKAMELMEGGNYEIAVDAEGNEKVIVNGGDIREVDKDTLLVMKLIKTIYDLYGDDINELWYRRERYRMGLRNEQS